MPFQIQAPSPKENLKWLAPTPSELVLYFFLIAITFTLSNSDAIRNFLVLPPNFSLGSALLQAIGGILEKLLGPDIAGWLLTTILWALVGLLCYLLIWAVINLSLELENDLAVAKYMQPNREVRAYSSLRSFVIHALVRIGAFSLLFFLLLFTIQIFLPLWLHHYQGVWAHWPEAVVILRAVLAALGELLVLHLFTVFVRLLFLRQRIFT